jgi:hypothetical protein
MTQPEVPQGDNVTQALREQLDVADCLTVTLFPQPRNLPFFIVDFSNAKIKLSDGTYFLNGRLKGNVLYFFSEKKDGHRYRLEISSRQENGKVAVALRQNPDPFYYDDWELLGEYTSRVLD